MNTMCLWFISEFHVLVNNHCQFKMWSALHISLFFAYATAIPSSPKRSVPDKSTPAKEFEGMCAQYATNNFKIVNCVVK